MLLSEQELGALALEAAEEVIGAELEDVGGVVLLDLAFKRPDLVRVLGGERHGGLSFEVRDGSRLLSGRSCGTGYRRACSDLLTTVR